ncbi:hypothetical protein B7R54_10130 [Subtercola boreus]|uniref:Alpha/beta hydrolase fold-3 domain-containing protein n=1 Tax=Subtercola boreus TaxID=120213 RepID=A0A3E0VKY9_9MICO|nr:alpha/beta hydrolase fold domain-containing protein [Subtercola boreus]RFA09537.1 hypothetical protein B7R54_10130 [Subtercola boreus]TQL53396.1 acetyl esterase/lipase [Subtercola boreus]
MSSEAQQGEGTGGRSGAAWAIEHVPFVRGLSAGRRVRGVDVRDEMLAPPFDAVRLRRFERVGGAGPDAPLVVFFTDASAVAARGRRSGDWLAGSLARRLPLAVTTVQLPASVLDDREAAFEALLRAIAVQRAAGGEGAAGAEGTAGGPGAAGAAPKVALLGVGTGGALAARTAMRARDAGEPVIQRQALISPDFALIAGPPATEDALRTSLVARLGELPATLVQQYGDRATSRSDPSQNLVELLRESGVAVRAIAYPPQRLDWTEYPRAVRSSSRALDDLVAFLERGIVADGFDVVPAWNLH